MHNVKIENCMMVGRFAEAQPLETMFQGQALSHLQIGNNVKIGGGSGVVKDILDNTVVMGYPAVPLKEFLKKGKNSE